jgi:hypothetical protein
MTPQRINTIANQILHLLNKAGEEGATVSELAVQARTLFQATDIKKRHINTVLSQMNRAFVRPNKEGTRRDGEIVWLA